MFSNHDDPAQTIASSGCGATTMAMVLATFLDANISPPDVAQLIVDNGFRTDNNGVDWGFYPWAAEHYGLRFEQTLDTDAVIEALRAGALVVASMGPGYFTKFGHYILLWGLDEENEQILVNDPNSETRTRAGYGLFRDEACNYFIYYDPKGEASVEEVKEVVVPDWAKSAVMWGISNNIINTQEGSPDFYRWITGLYRYDKLKE
jgi:hypothetical protein